MLQLKLFLIKYLSYYKHYYLIRGTYFGKKWKNRIAQRGYQNCRQVFISMKIFILNFKDATNSYMLIKNICFIFLIIWFLNCYYNILFKLFFKKFLCLLISVLLKFRMAKQIFFLYYWLFCKKKSTSKKLIESKKLFQCTK